MRPMPATTPRVFFTAAELAIRLGVSRSTIAIAVRTGELPPAASLALRGGREQPLYDRWSIRELGIALHRRYGGRPAFEGFLARLDEGVARQSDRSTP